MDVDGAEGGDGQEPGREDLSVSHHDDGVGREIPDHSRELPAPDSRRLEERYTPVARESRHGGREESRMATRGPIGLAHDRLHPESGVPRESLERGHGEVGRSEEDDAGAPS